MEAWLQFLIGPALLLVLGWWLDRRNDRRLRPVAQKVDESHQQVKNTHDTNLRDDLDKVIAGQEVLNTAVAGLVSRLDEHLEHSVSEEAELWRAIGRR